MADDDPTSQDTAPDAGPGTTKDRCQNCGTPLVGTYCHNCGQRHVPALGISILARRFFESVFELEDLEQGAWQTLLKAARNPGQVARRYADGQRKRFINPIGYFLMAAAITFLVFLLFKEDWIQGQAEMLRTTWASMGVDPTVLFGPEGPYRTAFGVTSTEEFAGLMFGWIQQLQTFTGVVMTVVASLLLWKLFPAFSLAETLVFELYVTAQATLYIGLFAPLCFVVAPALIGIAGPFLQIGLHAHAGRAFFEGRWKAWLLPPLAYLVGMFTLSLLSAIVGSLLL